MNREQIQLMRAMEAYVREETAGQHRALELLQRQQDAVVANDVSAFRAGAEALHAAVRSGAERARRRDSLVRRLADEFGVAPQTLSLSSIAQRAGDEGGRLQRLQRDLADIVRRVSRKTKQVHALARMHEKLYAEVIQTVLLGAQDAAVHSGGQLVNAQV